VEMMKGRWKDQRKINGKKGKRKICVIAVWKGAIIALLAK
jgi:hypothetical protein